MADEQNPNLQPTPSPEPKPEVLGNQPEARNPDGSLKGNPSPSPEPEKKPESAPTEGEKKAEPEKKVEGAPEAYAQFTAPEGYELNKEVLDKAVPIFKELGLSQEGAQKLVDFYGEAALKAEEAPYKAYEDMRSGWRKDIIGSDLGNGTDGLRPEVAKLLTDAKAILDPKVASAFNEAMTMTGAGDNPAVVRGFHAFALALQKAGAIGEGTLVTGRGPSPAGQTNRARPASPAQALYPNLPSSAR